jgi:hypothetical protein
LDLDDFLRDEKKVLEPVQKPRDMVYPIRHGNIIGQRFLEGDGGVAGNSPQRG